MKQELAALAATIQNETKIVGQTDWKSPLDDETVEMRYG